MKPEWCPQWATDEATRVYHSLENSHALNEDAIARALLAAEQRGRKAGLEEAAKLLDEGYSREVGHHYRKDRQPSKHDRCPHGRYTYEDCESCGAAAIRAKANEVKP